MGEVTEGKIKEGEKEDRVTDKEKRRQGRYCMRKDGKERRWKQRREEMRGKKRQLVEKIGGETRAEPCMGKKMNEWRAEKKGKERKK